MYSCAACFEEDITESWLSIYNKFRTGRCYKHMCTDFDIRGDPTVIVIL